MSLCAIREQPGAAPVGFVKSDSGYVSLSQAITDLLQGFTTAKVRSKSLRSPFSIKAYVAAL